MFALLFVFFSGNTLFLIVLCRTILAFKYRINHLRQSPQHEFTSLLRKKYKTLEKLIQYLTHKRILPIESPIEPLNDQLAQKKFHLIMICILSEFSWEKHFTNTFDSNLSEDAIFYHHVVFNYNSLKFLSSFWFNTMNDKGVYRGFQGDYFFS
jgi:hypothetical protein